MTPTPEQASGLNEPLPAIQVRPAGLAVSGSGLVGRVRVGWCAFTSEGGNRARVSMYA
jgi:hypothetical protein